jgi:hypothetical protein
MAAPIPTPAAGREKSQPTARPVSKTALPVDYPVSRRCAAIGGSMRYLCLIYDDEKVTSGMSKDEGDAFMGEYFSFTNDIKASGHYLGGEALQGIDTATTLRIRNGKVSTTDGPFAETKEQLGGFYLIKANDLNEAIQIASRIPSARIGSIEIRPVVEFG